jgi:iron(III) transport system ATP-binding protein
MMMMQAVGIASSRHYKESEVDLRTASASASHNLVLKELVKKYGSFTAVRSLDLAIPKGSLVSLLGPSGCGKTTTLRCIAGLEQPNGGEIRLDGKLLADHSFSEPPERRGMGMVFQSYALWPHMAVADNVAFGLKRHGWAKDDRARQVGQALELVGMGSFASRYPGELSGGQQQRVALARALAIEPEVLLLDEPLSNLDAVLRESMRFEIRSLQQRLGITSLYVTHSQDEALAISDQVVVMYNGVIQQSAPPEQIYLYPRNAFVANFIGLANILDVSMSVENDERMAAVLPNGATVLVKRRGNDALEKSSSGKLMIRPENIRIERAGMGSERSARVEAVVTRSALSGNMVDYFVEVSGLERPLRIQATPPIKAVQGDKVALEFPPEACILLERDLQ